MLRKNAKIELLKRVPLFAGLSNAELAEVALIADEVDFPAGKELIREGERGREFIVLVSGEVELSKDGRKLPLRGGSEFFGEMALLTDAPRSATIVAATPLRALVIEERAFRPLVDRHPSIQGKMLRTLAERIAPQHL